MLATIIRDEFRWAERESIAEALDELCNPNDDWGWASAGVYAFWEVDGPSLLYIGLASDLAQRFRQHIGLLRAPPAACKLREIKAHFARSKTLGYSVLVQSTMSQPRVSRTKLPVGDDADFPLDGVGAIKFSEGLLLSGYNRRHGALPPWNKVGGAIEGQGRATAKHCFLVDLLSGIGDDTMVARRTLRQLGDDATACTFEQFLHAVRMHTPDHSFVETYTNFPDSVGDKERIEAGYWTSQEMGDIDHDAQRRFADSYLAD